ncbi:MAG: capsule assembly Wzi family protein [Acidobacteriaceae bacterium]
MNLCKRGSVAGVLQCAIALVLAAFVQLSILPLGAQQPPTPQQSSQAGPDLSGPASRCEPLSTDSPYIPIDSWIYPAVMRLYSMEYGDNVFLGMRPWTRASVSRMLERTSAEIADADMYGDSTAGEALKIYSALVQELHADPANGCLSPMGEVRIESAYSAVRAISGTPLRDSYHLGSTIVNDYGRPYENGINNYSGASGYASKGRFLLYARGEFQGAPSATGYSTALAQTLSNEDNIPFINPATGLPFNQATIPLGPISATADGRLLEAYASVHLLDHEISFGKQDEWLGPGMGGAMAYSNNAENIYAFHINRIEPLYVPLLSRITGPFRYEFLVGSLKGHTDPNDPWMHLEKVSFRPTQNLEMGFERTVIWGGKGHEPITLHTFLRSFFSLSAPNGAVKFSPADPGARFGAFDFSYRLPFVRNWLTLYSDSEVHDDVSPIDAPRRAAIRPGLYISHVPRIPKLDFRIEAASTDPSISTSQGGHFMYYEGVQKQGYTNQGQLFGDWIGREDKGGQAWITYHLSGNEWLQLGLRNQKVAKDFIPGGTTINDINFRAVKRIGRDFEIDGNFKFEQWKVPIYLPGRQTVTATTIQLTWFPGRKVKF